MKEENEEENEEEDIEEEGLYTRHVLFHPNKQRIAMRRYRFD